MKPSDQRRQSNGRWIRLYAALIHQPKVIRLPDRQFRVMVTCWCVADADTGLLPPLADIAVHMRADERETLANLEALTEYGLLDPECGLNSRDRSPRWRVHDWATWQYNSDRAKSAERMRKMRERRKGSETPVTSLQRFVTRVDKNRKKDNHRVRANDWVTGEDTGGGVCDAAVTAGVMTGRRAAGGGL